MSSPYFLFSFMPLLILRLHCISNNVLCVYSFYSVYVLLVSAEGLPEGIKPSICNASRILYSGVEWNVSVCCRSPFSNPPVHVGSVSLDWNGMGWDRMGWDFGMTSSMLFDNCLLFHIQQYCIRKKFNFH